MEYNIWKSSQAKRNIKEGIKSVWWHCEYLFGRNHFGSLAAHANEYTGILALLLYLMDFFVHLSSPSFLWHLPQAIQYHCSGDTDGKLFHGDISSPFPPTLFFPFPLSLSTGSSCLSCNTLYLVPTPTLTMH